MRRDRSLSLLRQAEAQFREAIGRGTRAVDVAGYRVHIWPKADPFYRNVAVPADGQAVAPASIAAMCRCFAQERREPRLELIEELWPNVPAALEQAGFHPEMRAPVLALDRPPPSGKDVVSTSSLLGPEVGLAVATAYLEAAERAFDVGGIATVEECRGLADALAEGRTLVAAQYAGGVPVAGAALTGITDCAELAGVWCAPNYRRRGFARAAALCVVQAFFARGGELVWLSAAGEGSLPLYLGLGFVQIGTQLNYVMPPGRRPLPR